MHRNKSFVLVTGIFLSIFIHFSTFLTLAQVPGSMRPCVHAPLYTFILEMSGVWTYGPTAEDPGYFCITLDPAQVYDDQVRVEIEEYCRPGIADYLHFRLDESSGTLEYTGASIEGCYFDLAKIDFVRLSAVFQGRDTLLKYEAHLRF